MLMENPLELAKSDLCKRWSQFLCRMLKLFTEPSLEATDNR